MKKTCLNPACQKEFSPGHYGILQKVCSGRVQIPCPKCHGSGKADNQKCGKCDGKKRVQQSCREWYRGYWSQTRKPPRGIPSADLERILATVRKDVVFWSLIEVAAQSALRKGELLGLTWGDVADGGKIRSSFPLRGQWDDQVGAFKATKTGTGRIAYLLERARKALEELHKKIKRPLPTDRVWDLREAKVWKRFVAIQKRLKILSPETGRPYRFHDLRHTAALNAYEATKDIKKAAVLCGHRSLSTTLRYTEQRPEAFVESLEQAIRKMK